MRRGLAAGLITALATAHTAHAAEPATPIRSFDLPTTERLGASLYYQDTAAWRATDALLAKVPDLAKEKITGWVVIGDGKAVRVRFLRDRGAGLEAAYDINDPLAETPKVTIPTDRSVTLEERLAFTARQTAISGMGPVCRKGYNTAVLHDVEGDGWLVWLLAPSPAKGMIPVGGHYRFSISADGETVKERDALSVSCLTIGPDENLPAGAKPAGVFVTHVVSPTPVETHVFLQLEYHTPMMIGAGGKMWKVDQGHIQLMGDVPKAPSAGNNTP